MIGFNFPALYVNKHGVFHLLGVFVSHLRTSGQISQDLIIFDLIVKTATCIKPLFDQKYQVLLAPSLPGTKGCFQALLFYVITPMT